MDVLKRFKSKGANVSFIGAGNVAWHLAPALDNTDFAVKEVFSLHKKNAVSLVDKLYQAEVKTTLDFSDSPSQIFIIAVKDDVIKEVVNDIVLPKDAVLVHTSGSQPLSVLASSGVVNIGVLYPLQTFSKSKKVDFKDIPFFVESENAELEKLLMTMAKAVSKKVYKCSSDDRKALHVAAVFASNFVNHMLTIAQETLRAHQLDLSLLHPLIAETINKSFEIGPEKAQTGPASRGDVEILDNHYEFLKQDENVAEIYRIISQHILDRYQE